MKTLILKVYKKSVALVLSFCLITELSTQALANVSDLLTNGYEDAASGLSWKVPAHEQTARLEEALQNAYERGESANIYENALRVMLKTATENSTVSPEAKNLSSAKTNGKNKYGNMWPAYTAITASKQISSLEQSLIQTLSLCVEEPQVMPFSDFEPIYENYISFSAQQYIKDNPAFNNGKEAIINQIRKEYPANNIYKEYVKEAQAEINWRKDNSATVADYCRRSAAAYIKAIGAPALTFQTVLILKDLQIYGQNILTTQDVKDIYEYNIKRLETQDLSALDLSILSNESKKKVAQNLSADITQRIIIGAAFSKKGDKKYLSAVENLIYKSEDGAGFSQIFAAGFGALLAKDGFDNIENILKKYTKKEYEGPGFLDYINLSHWAQAAETIRGKYLGSVSENTQYTTQYTYGNTFTDIAALLSEDGRPESISLLYRYGTGNNNPIKPFLAGALLAKKNGIKEENAKKQAIILANTQLADITATQEYDLDTALLSKYPSIEADLGNFAVINENAKNAKANKKHTFGYVKRAAFGGDIILAVWGITGLVKLSGKAITLSKATYIAAKASKIPAANAARFAFLKMNYASVKPYISAQRSLARFGNKIKTGAGFEVPARQTAKLASDLRKKQIAALQTQSQTSALKSAQLNTPQAAAKAELDAKKLQAAVVQDKLILNQKLYSESYNLKVSSYLDKVRAYNSGKTSLVPQEPVFTAGEKNLINLNKNFQTALTEFNQAKNNYNGLKWYNRNLITPLKNWMAEPYNGKISLPITEMETAEGTTIAKSLGLSETSYTAPVLKDLGGNTKPFNSINKVYAWLEDHHLPFAAQGLKFINNKATILGTALLFNYNVAAISPAVASTTKTLTLTEHVISAPKTAKTLNAFNLSANDIARASGLRFSNLKPAEIVDPKIFKHYKTLPLISGDIIKGNTTANLFASFKNTVGGLSLASFSTNNILGKGSSWKAQSLPNTAVASTALTRTLLPRISSFLFKKDAKPRAAAFFYNFLAATTVTATAPLISQIYGLDTNTTNTAISLISYLPAMAVPFMGYFFNKYGVINMAKVASWGTLSGVVMSILGGFNGFSNNGTMAGLISTLGGIGLISLSNEIKYATIYPLIDTNFNTQKALSLTTLTSMARSLGTILFLEFGPLINMASTSLGLGQVNNAIVVPLLLLPLSSAAVISMMKGNYKDVPMPKDQKGSAVKGLVDVFKQDPDARKAAGAFAFIEGAELTTSLLVFSMAQEFYGTLSNIPNILGGVLIYTTMGAARMACAELQKRNLLSSLSTYKISSGLALGGLTLFALGGISPLGITGAAMYFVGDATLFPPLLNTTLKGKGDKTANITLLIFSFSTLAALGGSILGLVSDLSGSLKFAVTVPIAFLGSALALVRPIFAQHAKSEEVPYKKEYKYVPAAIVQDNNIPGKNIRNISYEPGETADDIQSPLPQE